MARRSQNTSSVCAYKGRFFRNLGKISKYDGTIVQKKFLLGTDLRNAEIANGLLEKLWACIILEHQAAEQFVVGMRGRLGDVNQLTGVVDYQRIRDVACGPVWREETLAIAEAIRKGSREIVVEVGDDAQQPDKYVERVTNLRKQYDVIVFVPASADLYKTGCMQFQVEAQQIADDSSVEVQRLSAMAHAPLPVVTGQSLHDALEAYAKFAVQKNAKAHGDHEAASAKRLKCAHVDVPLSSFGISALEAIAAYWSGRPLSKSSGKPVALSTITNHLKTTRRFIKWLHRTDAFEWSKPVDAEDALRVRVAGLRNREEISALKDGVAVWRIDELSTLYRYANDKERLLILLGLNCGFAQAEICTLLLSEIVESPDQTVVKRIRHKSQVYGEFTLWNETMTALNWFRNLARGTPATNTQAVGCLMVTAKGNCYDRSLVANSWNKLLDRVQPDFPAFRRMSFKSLRKTAGQLIRERSDGEVSGVFLCHGQAVSSDSLADVYTNRPFNKVADALAKVSRDIQCVFDAAPARFNEKPGSSPNVSVATIDQIQKMASAGMSHAEIAETTGKTLQTVRRWANRLQPTAR